MAKYYLTLLLAISLQSKLIHARPVLGITAGIRTGAFQEFYSLGKKENILDLERNIRRGFHHQVFVNKQLGKKASWMIEFSAGYSSYSIERDSYFPGNVYAYSFTKTNVFDFQLKGRYAFLYQKALRWKHYLGLSLSANHYDTKWYSFDNGHNPGEFERKSGEDNAFYCPYFGAEYFGKMDLSRKLSVQYLLNYALYDPKVSIGPDLISSNQPVNHRINFNVGLGWHF